MYPILSKNLSHRLRTDVTKKPSNKSNGIKFNFSSNKCANLSKILQEKPKFRIENFKQNSQLHN